MKFLFVFLALISATFSSASAFSTEQHSALVSDVHPARIHSLLHPLLSQVHKHHMSIKKTAEPTLSAACSTAMASYAANATSNGCLEHLLDLTQDPTKAPIFCNAKCDVSMIHNMEVVLAACKEDAATQGSVLADAFSDSSAISVTRKTVNFACLKENNEYCYPKFMRAANELQTMSNLNETTLEKLCGPCSIKTAAALGAMVPDSEGVSMVNVFELMCSKEDGKFCFPVFMEMANYQNGNGNSQEPSYPGGNPDDVYMSTGEYNHGMPSGDMPSYPSGDDMPSFSGDEKPLPPPPSSGDDKPLPPPPSSGDALPVLSGDIKPELPPSGDVKPPPPPPSGDVSVDMSGDDMPSLSGDEKPLPPPPSSGDALPVLSGDIKPELPPSGDVKPPPSDVDVSSGDVPPVDVSVSGDATVSASIPSDNETASDVPSDSDVTASSADLESASSSGVDIIIVDPPTDEPTPDPTSSLSSSPMDTTPPTSGSDDSGSSPNNDNTTPGTDETTPGTDETTPGTDETTSTDQTPSSDNTSPTDNTTPSNDNSNDNSTSTDTSSSDQTTSSDIPLPDLIPSAKKMNTKNDNDVMINIIINDEMSSGLEKPIEDKIESASISEEDDSSLSSTIYYTNPPVVISAPSDTDTEEHENAHGGDGGSDIMVPPGRLVCNRCVTKFFMKLNQTDIIKQMEPMCMKPDPSKDEYCVDRVNVFVNSTQHGGEACGVALKDQKCNDQCNDFIQAAMGKLGCCAGPIFSVPDFGFDQQIEAMRAIKCAVPQFPTCARPLAKISLNLVYKNLKYSYYTANKATIDAGVKKDIATRAGVLLEKVKLMAEAYTSSSSSSSSSRSAFRARVLSTDAGVKFTSEIEVDQGTSTSLQTELDSSVKSGSFVLPTVSTLPESSKVDPLAAATVDTSASVVVATNQQQSGAASVSATFYAAVFAVIALLMM